VAQSDQDRSLREQLRKLLDWEDAHIGFDRAIKDIDPNLRGKVPKGLPHSLWQLLEHLRRCQFDILDFCRNPKYVEVPFEEYWPPSAVPPLADAWDKSVASYRRDREELKRLAADPAVDLFARIPHGSGQTILRELLVVADHGAYHVGQIVDVRRALGDWKG
jgi:uncharacterized damage-inducible protein DinB